MDKSKAVGVFYIGCNDARIQDEVYLPGEKLKKKINTDAVLITKTEVEYRYI